jgi:hypothetical protein
MFFPPGDRWHPCQRRGVVRARGDSPTPPRYSSKHGTLSRSELLWRWVLTVASHPHIVRTGEMFPRAEARLDEGNIAFGATVVSRKRRESA